jgi:formylglycine-generating enzyme required for sulfatase activity
LQRILKVLTQDNQAIPARTPPTAPPADSAEAGRTVTAERDYFEQVGGQATVITGAHTVNIYQQGRPLERPEQSQRQKPPRPAPTPKTAEPLQEFRFETVLVNAQGKIVKREQHTAQQYIEDLGHGVVLELVSIPGGTFLMGAPKSEAESSDYERPQHQVTLAPFYLGKYPVTQAQWQAVMGDNPSYFKGANRPVEQVSWNDVQEFLRRLNTRVGQEVYRLPTEAEWEYACRAGTMTPFYFGETMTTDLANYRGIDWEFGGTVYPGSYGAGPKGIFREQTTDVGSFPPNVFGLYDMHGNVWEWCQDWYDEDYYQNSPKENPQGPTSGSYRVFRGGSWSYFAGVCRAALRNFAAPSYCSYVVGFRLLMTPS